MERELGACPSCDSWEQEVLHETAGHITVKCLECESVRKESPRTPRIKRVGLIISDGPESTSHFMDIADSDEIPVGAEFDFNGMPLQVTGLEAMDGRSPIKSEGRDLRTIFARRFDLLTMKVTLNEGAKTRALVFKAPPYQEIAIGEGLTVDGERMVVKSLKSTENRTVRRGVLPMVEIRRIFCDPAKKTSSRSKPRTKGP